jgi:hypothetical protein
LVLGHYARIAKEFKLSSIHANKYMHFLKIYGWKRVKYLGLKHTRFIYNVAQYKHITHISKSCQAWQVTIKAHA